MLVLALANTAHATGQGRPEGAACVFTVNPMPSHDILEAALGSSLVYDTELPRAAALFNTTEQADAFCSNLLSYDHLNITDIETLPATKTRAVSLRRCCGFLCTGWCNEYYVKAECRCKKGCNTKIQFALAYDDQYCANSNVYNKGTYCSMSIKLKFKKTYTFAAKMKTYAYVGKWEGYNNYGNTETVRIYC
jgi:hypothetical protein